MSKINIIYELEPTFLDENTPEHHNMKDDNEKNIKIPEKVFGFMLDEGLLRKTDTGYVFVGSYDDFLNKKKKIPRSNR